MMIVIVMEMHDAFLLITLVKNNTIPHYPDKLKTFLICDARSTNNNLPSGGKQINVML